MVRNKIALKRLTASDLTFFEWHFKHHNAGNQKAINLNRNVFVDQLYPSVPEAAVQMEGKIPLDLTIYGPGMKKSLNLQRKIRKIGSYKNWRLDGEFIYNPTIDEERFNSLQAGDFAIIDFSGPVVPISARLYLLGMNYAKDASLHKAIDKFMGDKRMLAVNMDELEDIISQSGTSEDHPVFGLTMGEALEDAALGGISGMERLWKPSGGHHLTHESLQKARQNAGEVGQQGEEFVNLHLEELLEQKDIGKFSWVSSENAVSPFDFEIEYPDESVRYVDAKSTTGAFGRKIHISMNELRWMSGSGVPYDIYRLYEMDDSSACMKVAYDMEQFAKDILVVFNNLPIGVLPDGISVDPNSLTFGDEIKISLPPELFE